MMLQVAKTGPAALIAFLAWLIAGALQAAESTNSSPILANLSFDQLSQIQIVSLSKRPESVSAAPAAVQVVSGEDIQRSGATSIPEALRAVPGLNVAQIHGNTWAIGARGFQSEFASKLLVMEDGVSVYTPIYSGVYWDEQDYILPDLEQIEVVLGPGGSIWGANAMNGVINIITKSARDTQGGLVYAGGGSEKEAMTGARYGWQVGTNTYVRVYGKYDANNSQERFGGGGPANDATRSGQGGFRADGYPRETTTWTLKGDVHWENNDSTAYLPALNQSNYVFTNNSPGRIFGGQLMGHWQTELNPDSTLQLQSYYDNAQRSTTTVDANVHTADVELHHTWSGWRRQVIDWGLDGRFVHLDTQPAWAGFVPAHDTEWLGSGFVQDEITLVPDSLKINAGIKLEGHSDAGFLPQPNVRLTWQPAAEHTLWASWSQALRSPSKLELDGQFDVGVLPPGASTFNPTTPAVLNYLGNPQVKPENLQAWEIGWRWQPRTSLTLDVNGYYYQYRDLIMSTYGTPYYQSSPAAVVVPTLVANGTEGDAFGGEVAATWQPVERWFAKASYSFEHIALHSTLSDPFDFAGDSRTSPRNTVALTSGVKLGREVDLTGALRYLDNIAYYNIPAYFALDLQLTWKPSEHWELAIAGQNLLQDYHKEYRASLVDQSAEIRRGVYGRVTWKF